MGNKQPAGGGLFSQLKFYFMVDFLVYPSYAFQASALGSTDTNERLSRFLRKTTTPSINA